MNRRSFIKITTALGAALAFGGSLISASVKAVARSLGRRTCVWGGGEGEWDDPKMWIDQQVPRDGDNVVIYRGHIFGGMADGSIRKLSIYGGAVQIGSQLDYASPSITNNAGQFVTKA